MNEDRKAKLDAAAVLFRMFRSSVYCTSLNRASDANMSIERNLTAVFDKARQELDSFRASKAAAMAITSILPGAVEVDASDYVPRELWDAFVSNDEGEWVEWIAANARSDVPREKIEELVRKTFERSRQP